MNYFNYHTHTLFCDGKDIPEAFIKEAIHQKMSAIGFSSHSPVPFNNNYSIKENRVDDYKDEIRKLQKKYKKEIDVFLSLEFDYIQCISDDFNIFKNRIELDYSIGSVHLVKNKITGKLWFIDGPEINYKSGLSEIFNNDGKLAVTAYFEQVSEMIITQKPTIIGHIDKVKMHNKNRFFSEEESWYKALIKTTLNNALITGSIIEVNTRGIYTKRCDSLYPGIFVLKEINKMGIPITISSDAHNPNELTSYFGETISILKDIGFKSIKRLDGKLWKNFPI
jgi:histidinol-phosphatase (PHP family)